MIAALCGDCQKPESLLLYDCQRTILQQAKHQVADRLRTMEVAGNRMAAISPRTRFTRFSRRHALLVVGAMAAAMIWCLVVAVTPKKTDGFVPADGSDLR